MAKMYTTGGREEILTRPKKSRQGQGKHTKYAASSRNGKPKRSRGQVKLIKGTRKSPYFIE